MNHQMMSDHALREYSRLRREDLLREAEQARLLSQIRAPRDAPERPIALQAAHALAAALLALLRA